MARLQDTSWLLPRPLGALVPGGSQLPRCEDTRSALWRGPEPALEVAWTTVAPADARLQRHERPWPRTTVNFLTSRNCDIVSVCCLTLLRFGEIYYTTIRP